MSIQESHRGREQGRAESAPNVSDLRAWCKLGSEARFRAAVGGSEADLKSCMHLSLLAGCLGLQVRFLYPEDAVPLGDGSVAAASFPPFLRGSPQPGLKWGLITCVSFTL